MPKIIAEFCQNHNGDYDTLQRMVSTAAASGATHGKIQTILANTVTFRPQFENGLTIDGTVRCIKRPYQVEYDRLKKLELSDRDSQLFIKSCADHGLTPLTTCFTRSHAQHLYDIGFRSIKVASYDCASFALLRDLKLLFDNIIVSTGATFDHEITHAAQILNGSNYSFLHCVTIYPTPLASMNLARINWLKSFTSSVGFSDHSLFADTGVIASKAALACGADIIERHFTVLPSSTTRDGPVSVTPEGLKDIAVFSKLSLPEQLQYLDQACPEWRIMIGDSHRNLTDRELLNRDYYRGRFASPRPGYSSNPAHMIYNWEETPLS